jgi:hypothetical protein
MPAAAAEQISFSLQADYECADVASENINILSSLLSRSSMRSLEGLLLNNPGVRCSPARSCLALSARDPTAAAVAGVINTIFIIPCPLQVLLSPLGSWFEFLSAYGVSRQAFCGILLWQAGRIITDSNLAVAGNVILTLQRWGLSSSDINRSVLQRAPQALLLQQEHLQQLHSFLRQACGLPNSRVRDLVVATPLVLLQDVQQQLQPRLRSLVDALGADQQQLAAVLAKLPGLLMADHSSSIQPRLQQLQAFGFLDPELRQLVCADPAVLTLSCSSLQRKWDFLTVHMGLGREQVLQQCPGYFSKALVSEVGPRYSYIALHGLQERVACQPAPMAQQPQQQQRRQQQQRQQQQEPQQQLHLGKLLDPSIPEFLAALGRAGAAAEFEAHAQRWAQTEGLKWTAARVISS